MVGSCRSQSQDLAAHLTVQFHSRMVMVPSLRECRLAENGPAVADWGLVHCHGGLSDSSGVAVGSPVAFFSACPSHPCPGSVWLVAADVLAAGRASPKLIGAAGSVLP